MRSDAVARRAQREAHRFRPCLTALSARKSARQHHVEAHGEGPRPARGRRERPPPRLPAAAARPRPGSAERAVAASEGGECAAASVSASSLRASFFRAAREAPFRSRAAQHLRGHDPGPGWRPKRRSSPTDRNRFRFPTAVTPARPFERALLPSPQMALGGEPRLVLPAAPFSGRSAAWASPARRRAERRVCAADRRAAAGQSRRR